MTRAGSRDHGHQPQRRPPAGYTTGQLPPADAKVLHCACGGIYRNYPDSEHAHLVVFGHRPIRKPAPAPAESAPDQHPEGARWTG